MGARVVRGRTASLQGKVGQMSYQHRSAILRVLLLCARQLEDDVGRFLCCGYLEEGWDSLQLLWCLLAD